MGSAKDGDVDYRLHTPDFEKKFMYEKEIDKQPAHLINIRVVFDDYEKLLFYTSLFGIHVYNLEKGKDQIVLAKEERNERFVGLYIYQGGAMADTSGQTGKGGSSSQQKEFDPCLFATSYKKRR